MSWNVYAVCDNCGRESGRHWNRSGLWRILSRGGWTKSSGNRTYCPECRAAAKRENRKLREAADGKNKRR